MTIHGDDFTMTGPEEGLEEAEKMIRNTFEVKAQRLDCNKVGDEMVVLNRRIVVPEQGYAYEPDGKHSLKVLRELGLDEDGSKGSLVPGAKVEDPGGFAR